MPKQQTRPATARFDTKECKVLLRIINQALEAKVLSPGLLFVGGDEIEKIKAKLERRIKAEEENEIRARNKEGNQETVGAPAVGG